VNTLTNIETMCRNLGKV